MQGSSTHCPCREHCPRGARRRADPRHPAERAPAVHRHLVSTAGPGPGPSRQEAPLTAPVPPQVRAECSHLLPVGEEVPAPSARRVGGQPLPGGSALHGGPRCHRVNKGPERHLCAARVIELRGHWLGQTTIFIMYKWPAARSPQLRGQLLGLGLLQLGDASHGLGPQDVASPQVARGTVTPASWPAPVSHPQVPLVLIYNDIPALFSMSCLIFLNLISFSLSEISVLQPIDSVFGIA